VTSRLNGALLFILAAALLGTQPAAAQRPLGPPIGSGGLEGTVQDAPEPEPETPLIPMPVPSAKASGADAALPDRTGHLLGEIEILDIPLNMVPNYRGEMRDIFEELSLYAHQRNPEFIFVTRPGFDLLTWSRREFDLEEIKRPAGVVPPPDTIVPVGAPMRRYIQMLDGFILNGQFCSPLRVPRADLAAMRKQGLTALSIEHCPDIQTAGLGIQAAVDAGVIAHVDTDDEDIFATIPLRRPVPENAGNVQALSEARNFLMFTDTRRTASKEDYLYTLQRTNYDVLVVDAFYNNNQPLTAAEIHSLKFKDLGARRLVLARMDVGYAEDTRFYWQRDWKIGSPSWIKAFGPMGPGQYVVEFWNPAWKAILGRYFAGIMDLGFDGVVIDGAEAYRRFEFMTPLDPAAGM